LKCLLERGGLITPELEKRLIEAGINVPWIRKCLEGVCSGDCHCR